jgi:hypothetical protein
MLPQGYKKIAGNGKAGPYGIAVVATPDIERAYKELLNLASKGDHWAGVATKNISSLTSSHFKPNVFVQQLDETKFPEFVMSLPGLAVFFRKRSNSEYVVYRIKRTASFQQGQESFKEPGLFEVVKDREVYQASLRRDGRIKSVDNRVVVVSDASSTLDDAVQSGVLAMKDSPFATFGKRSDFDLHCTPGPEKFGGLRNYKQAMAPELDSELRKSAMLLSRTIYEARKIKGVNWVSDGGGSAVLTQAMYLLAQQGVSLKDSEHYVYFGDLTSNLLKAQKFAEQIGFKFERKNKSIDYLKPSSVFGSGFGGAYLAAFYRYRSDPENYTLLKMSADVVAESTNAQGAGAVLLTTGAATAFALGFNPTTIGLSAGAAAIAAIAKSGLPKIYDKIKEKF